MTVEEITMHSSLKRRLLNRKSVLVVGVVVVLGMAGVGVKGRGNTEEK